MNSLLKFAQTVSLSVLMVASLITGWKIGDYAYTKLFVPAEKYVSVAEKVQSKTVMIAVPSVDTHITMTFDGGGFDMKITTVPVTYLGSGVFVSGNGFILSCAHVVDNPLRGPIVATLSNGTTAAAYVLYKSTDMDLALLKIKPKERPYNFARLSDLKLRIGQEVIAVGNPEGLYFTTTHGIISYLNRKAEEKYLFTQIDAPINPGNSGGPLFNLSGELIGINAMKYMESDGLGLAISPKTIYEFLHTFSGIGE